MTRRGRFITLEGSEGAGKSTNMDAVCDHLAACGVDYYPTREPGGTPMAEALRNLLLSRWEESVSGLSELLVVFAARAQHIENEIIPRLQRGQWVVCDRFTDATFAYQGHGRKVPLARIEQLETWVQGQLQPDLTLYLDVAVEVAQRRVDAREAEKDRLELEQRDFFTRVREGYLQRAEQHKRIVVINAGQELAQVQEDVVQVVSRFVDQHHKGS